jgi:hypothetical protein
MEIPGSVLSALLSLWNLDKQKIIQYIRNTGFDIDFEKYREPEQCMVEELVAMFLGEVGTWTHKE